MKYLIEKVDVVFMIRNGKSGISDPINYRRIMRRRRIEIMKEGVWIICDEAICLDDGIELP